MNIFSYEEIVQPLLQHHAKNKRPLPWRADKDPYHVWISEIMLQQTRIETVIPYYQRFMQVLPNIAALAYVDEENLLKLWEGLGYYSRARNLKKAALQIEEEFAGVFPHNLAEIRSLAGIGPYTAGAIASISFGLREPAIDGNVLRVFSRLSKENRDVTSSAFREELYTLLKQIYPKEAGDFTEALMELGETLCLPGDSPKCSPCPLKNLCLSFRDSCQSRYPVRQKKNRVRLQENTVFLIRCQNKYALRKRPSTGLLASLYEFPNCLCCEEASFLATLSFYNLKELCHYEHLFSHIRWKNTVKSLYLDTLHPSFLWFTKEEILQNLAIPSAFSAVLKQL